MRIFGWLLLGSLSLAGLPIAAAENQVDEIEATVTAMAKVGGSNSSTFSPDGKRIAFISTLSGSGQIWTVSSQGGWPDSVTSLSGTAANTLWSADGQWILFHYVAPPEVGQGQQIYIIRPDGTGLRRLTDGGKESNFTDGWSPDSRYVMIASNRLDGKSIDAYIYDMQRGELRLVSQTPALEELVGISRDGKHGLLFRQSNRGDNDLVLVDIETREERLLTPHTPPSKFSRGHLAPDGSAVYFTTDDQHDSEVLARVKLDAEGHPGAVEVLLERAGCNIDQMTLSPDGKTMAFSWNVAGRSELHFLDLATRTLSPPILIPNDIVNQLRFSPDGKELATLVIGSAAPPNIWILNRESGTFRQITHSSHPGVDLSKIIRPELVKFTAHDGVAVSGWMYRHPDAKGKLPLVIIIHGGPEGQERPTFLGTYQELVRQGIMVLGLNPRGSTGFGKHFTHLDDGPLRGDAIRDVKSAVDYLVAQGLADPAHVGVFGFSSGGLLALGAIVQYPGTFQAGALLSGLVDLEGFFKMTEPWMASISKSEYGDPEKDAEALRALSPIHRIDTVNVPLLVIHGALDTNVPVEQADRVVESLKRRQVPVEFLRFPDERHGVSELHNRIRYSVEVVKWFNAHLKEGAQPAASSQAENTSSKQ